LNHEAHEDHQERGVSLVILVRLVVPLLGPRLRGASEVGRLGANNNQVVDTFTLRAAHFVATKYPVNIEFDPAKDGANIAKHGISLARADDLHVRFAEIDDRFDYGETRWRAFGLIDGKPYSLGFIVTAGGVRAISLRRAHLEEYLRYV
jgi:uncharacterized DUF497 family protein